MSEPRVLTCGEALQAALATIDAQPQDDDRSALVAAKCKALMAGYDSRWSDSEWVTMQLEQTVRLPIVNPASGRISRTWTQGGKLDGVISGYGKTSLLEHKTTSDEISDPNAVYWRRLAIDSQVSKYMLQSWQAGLRLDGTLYDVIRKPSIRPKAISSADRKSIILTRRYCGLAVEQEDLDNIAAGDERESLRLYGLRLTADTLESPDRYFQRRMVPRLDGEILEYATELWAIAQEIRRARNSELHFRNSDACLQYGRPCEYLGVCSGHDSIDSDNWRQTETVHGELAGIEGDGKDVLTNSRIKCFQLCRRKHLYRYELGLRQIDEEEGEALYFGKLFHQALESWWSQQRSL